MMILDPTGKPFPVEQPSVEGEPSYVEFESSSSPWLVIILFGIIFFGFAVTMLIIILKGEVWNK